MCLDVLERTQDLQRPNAVDRTRCSGDGDDELTYHSGAATAMCMSKPFSTARISSSASADRLPPLKCRTATSRFSRLSPPEFEPLVYALAANASSIASSIRSASSSTDLTRARSASDVALGAGAGPPFRRRRTERGGHTFSVCQSWALAAISVISIDVNVWCWAARIHAAKSKTFTSQPYRS